jgi:hypothetical protein
MTAAGLCRRFVEESRHGDLNETWPEFAVESVVGMVNFFALAGRLLRALVPEYVPGEVRGGPDDEDE